MNPKITSGQCSTIAAQENRFAKDRQKTGFAFYSKPERLKPQPKFIFIRFSAVQLGFTRIPATAHIFLAENSFKAKEILKGDIEK